MEPKISRGDAVVVRHIDPLDIQVGDIVSYHSPNDNAVLITHRVTAFNPLTGRVTTKGDSNASADPSISSLQAIGRVVYVIPGAGGYINALHSWLGLVLLIYLPTAVLVTGELRRLGRFYLRPTYTHILYR